MAEYLLGKLSVEQLLSVLRESRGICSYAHLIIAANKIVEGDRTAAEKHLRESVDSGFYHYYAPNWSKAFLRRIQDPTWLPWLPPNESAILAKPGDTNVRPHATPQSG